MNSYAAATLMLRTADGRDIAFARDDKQLRHLAYAYASTVHGAQGQTHERVIAVLDSGHGHLSTQQTAYLQLSRARDNAVVLTDNREQLVETVEANAGERITALDAIGAPTKAYVCAERATAFVERLRTERERDAAIATMREAAQTVDAWLDDAERTVAAHPHATTAPDLADGYAYEEWHRNLETLVTRGRTAVREAVDSKAVEAHPAARVRDAMRRLERLLADANARAAERLAVARAQTWVAHWADAEDPEDPYRARPSRRLRTGGASPPTPPCPRIGGAASSAS